MLLLFFSYLIPVAFAQQNLFDDTLNDIKNNVQNPQTRPGEATTTVKVVDFSDSADNPLGSLPTDIATKLKQNTNLDSLDKIVAAAKTDSNKTKVNATDLTDFLNKQQFNDPKGNPLKLSSDEVTQIVNQIEYKGESQLYSVILTVAKTVRNLMGGLAVLWIILSGIRMILAQGEENVYTEQKNSITYALIGLIVILLIERGVEIIYGVPGVPRGIVTTGEGISPEILGLISFVKALMGGIAILMIMIAGFQIITANGEEEKITNQKKGIIWIIIGIVLVLINQFIIKNLYIQPVANQINNPKGVAIAQDNITNIINLFGTIAQYLLGFVGLVAFAALIYGAASLIANFGNDEMAGKAKKIITNAIVGIIIILSAFAIVSTLIKF